MLSLATTSDLLITSELLCQLSHTSINADGSIAHFAGAVNRFSGEESLLLRVSLNAEETVTVFLHYFFIRRQAEGG